jgi:hypothetical protein
MQNCSPVIPVSVASTGMSHVPFFQTKYFASVVGHVQAS